MKNVTLQKIVVACSIFVLMASVFGIVSAYAADKYVMKVGHADSLDIYVSRKHAQLVTFKELVNTNSGGRIEVEVYGAGSVGGEREIVESVIAGSMQATCASAVIGGFYPPEMIFSIPYLFPSTTVAWKVMDGPFGQKIADGLLKATGLRNLVFAEVGFRDFTNNKRPIHKPADMKGLKIRVQESPLFVNMVKGLGANPTPIAWPEVYTALQTGVVDGQENPVSVILVAKFAEVQKYLTLDRHVYGLDWFVVNDKWYQGLPKDLQKVIMDAAIVSRTVGRGIQQLNSAGIGLAKLKEQGMEIYAPTPEEMALFKEATQKPVIDWLKTKVDPKLIEEALQTVAEASK
jgi:tripartite ATP-independent transporter DctP family solute receptor